MGRKAVDITGQRFGHLTVIKKSEKKTKDQKAWWVCRCDCGNENVVRGECLRLGRTKSCGCNEFRPMDLTGHKYGYLTVIERAGRTSDGRIAWKCVCDCGNETIVNSNNLRSGNVKSCGCGNFRKGEEKIDKRIQHIWAGMHSRCYNEKATGYENYGGRGIRMCDDWIGENGCRHFYEWAKKNGYKDRLTIDRKDVNGNYEPSNCRWATIEEQMNNMRKSVRLLYKGRKVSPKELSELTGINLSTIRGRYRKYRGSDGKIELIDCSDWKPPSK